MESDSTVVNGIGNLIRDHLHIEVRNIDMDLIEAGVLDSLLLVELILHLEGQYGLTVSLDDLEIDHFRSIRAIGEFVERLRAT